LKRDRSRSQDRRQPERGVDRFRVGPERVAERSSKEDSRLSTLHNRDARNGSLRQERSRSRDRLREPTLRNRDVRDRGDGQRDDRSRNDIRTEDSGRVNRQRDSGAHDDVLNDGRERVNRPRDDGYREVRNDDREHANRRLDDEDLNDLRNDARDRGLRQRDDRGRDELGNADRKLGNRQRDARNRENVHQDDRNHGKCQGDIRNRADLRTDDRAHGNRQRDDGNQEDLLSSFCESGNRKYNDSKREEPRNDGRASLADMRNDDRDRGDRQHNDEKRDDVRNNDRVHGNRQRDDRNRDDRIPVSRDAGDRDHSLRDYNGRVELTRSRPEQPGRDRTRDDHVGSHEGLTQKRGGPPRLDSPSRRSQQEMRTPPLLVENSRPPLTRKKVTAGADPASSTTTFRDQSPQLRPNKSKDGRRSPMQALILQDNHGTTQFATDNEKERRRRDVGRSSGEKCSLLDERGDFQKEGARGIRQDKRGRVSRSLSLRVGVRGHTKETGIAEHRSNRRQLSRSLSLRRRPLDTQRDMAREKQEKRCNSQSLSRRPRDSLLQRQTVRARSPGQDLRARSREGRPRSSSKQRASALSPLRELDQARKQQPQQPQPQPQRREVAARSRSVRRAPREDDEPVATNVGRERAREGRSERDLRNRRQGHGDDDGRRGKGSARGAQLRRADRQNQSQLEEKAPVRRQAEPRKRVNRFTDAPPGETAQIVDTAQTAAVVQPLEIALAHQPKVVVPPNPALGKMAQALAALVARSGAKGKGKGEKGKGKGKPGVPLVMPDKFGETWEMPRASSGLHLVGEICPLPLANPWRYPIMDESRRSFAGYLPNPFNEQLLHAFFEGTKQGANWMQPMGPNGPIPRKTCWLVMPGCSCKYRYGGIEVEAQPYPPWMVELCTQVMPYFGITGQQDWPTSCNLNLYDGGQHSVGWHSDDERLFQGKFVDALILSLSLGAQRKFETRLNWPGPEDAVPFTRLNLGSGDLCTMEGMFQKHYTHRVPREEGIQGERINLTWRYIRKHDPQCPAARQRMNF